MIEDLPATLADVTAVSLERCSLVPRELMLARIAALIRTQPKINLHLS